MDTEQIIIDLITKGYVLRTPEQSTNKSWKNANSNTQRWNDQVNSYKQYLKEEELGLVFLNHIVRNGEYKTVNDLKRKMLITNDSSIAHVNEPFKPAIKDAFKVLTSISDTLCPNRLIYF